ncbi:nitroreductase/quinone reductase family protein [Streptomyces sp. NPDC057686]|uniref:nitroreductase/quinone reductase family protein n=1 Tax=Streptomyces sp. NPDC057686 TaxID=3346212 RepID=UPI00369F07BC
MGDADRQVLGDSHGLPLTRWVESYMINRSRVRRLVWDWTGLRAVGTWRVVQSAARAVGQRAGQARPGTGPFSAVESGRCPGWATKSVDNAAFRVLNRIGPARRAGVMMRADGVGSRTGRLRPTPLFHVSHDGGCAVVGSDFGQGHHPAWTANLLKTAHAFVACEGRQMPVTGPAGHRARS